MGVVGRDDLGTVELVTEVAGCLKQAGVTPLGIVQGASPNSILVALREDDDALTATLQTLHRELGLE